MPDLINLKHFKQSTSLDWLFNRKSGWCHTFKGKGTDLDSAKEFIEILKTKVEAEGKSRSADRARALEKLKGYLGTKTCLMGWTDLNTIAVQVALRVREPKLIFQGQSGTCGTNMVLINLAKRSPEKYVGLVMDLVTTGRTRLENFDLRMPGPVINGAEECQRCGMLEADYAVLGSIGRPSEVLGMWVPLIGGKDHFSGGTDLGELEELLVKLGYTSITKYIVQTEKALWDHPEEYRRCLTTLKNEVLSANRLVILKTSVKFAHYFREAYIKEHVEEKKVPRKALSGPLETIESALDTASVGHYVLLDEFTYNETNNEVTLKIYTYAFSIRRTIDLRAFKYYLRGYIIGTLI